VESLTVAIAEDHPIFRREVVIALEQDPAIEVVAEAADLVTVVRRLRRPPGVVLVDPSGPSGPVSAPVLGRLSAAGAVLVVMLGPDDDPLVGLLAGAAGAVEKAHLLRSGPELVRRAALGGPLLPPEVARRLLARVAELGLTRSPRTDELLRRLAGGCEPARPGASPGVSPGDTAHLLASAIMDLRTAAGPGRRAAPRPGPPGQAPTPPPVDSKAE
jgi:DNA-binding NarL/FixJ family response regulator